MSPMPRKTAKKRVPNRRPITPPGRTFVDSNEIPLTLHLSTMQRDYQGLARLQPRSRFIPSASDASSRFAQRLTRKSLTEQWSAVTSNDAQYREQCHCNVATIHG